MEIEVVGCNGIPTEYVGLKVAIAKDPNPQRSWVRFKLGTGSLDEISDVLFNQLMRERRVTKLPRPEKVDNPDGTHWACFDCVVGYGNQRLFNLLREGSDQNHTRFEWTNVDDGSFEFTTFAPLSEEDPITRRLHHLKKQPKLLYWIGTKKDSSLLDIWSDALQAKFDKEFLTEGKTHSVSHLRRLEELASWALMCAWKDEYYLIGAHIRLFASFWKLGIHEEELERRFTAGARLLLHDTSWEDFRRPLLEYLEKYN